MRKFSSKLSIFAIIIFLVPFIICLLNRHFANFKLKENKQILIVGHSHSECAYNDSLLEGVANFSHSGESYFYTYFKMEKLIERNPNIKTVFIEFTNNQICKSMNDWIWGEKYMSYRFPKYGVFMDLDSYKLLWKENPKGLMSSSKNLIKHSIKSMFKGFKNYEDIGGYIHLVRDKTDSLLANIQTFKLHVIDEIDYKDIASMQNIPIGTVKSRVFRGRKLLRDRYQEICNQETSLLV